MEKPAVTTESCNSRCVHFKVDCMNLFMRACIDPSGVRWQGLSLLDDGAVQSVSQLFYHGVKMRFGPSDLKIVDVYGEYNFVCRMEIDTTFPTLY